MSVAAELASRLSDAWEYWSEDERLEVVAMSMHGDPWAAQEGPQKRLLACTAKEIFFGGARGGGKSFGILLDWYQHQKRYGRHANGIIMRRTTTELEELIEESHRVFEPCGAWRKLSTNTWHFPNGSRLKFRHLDKDEDASKYQGHAYTWVGIEEAGSFPSPNPIDRMRGSMRSAHNVPTRMILTGNPGGPGHNWLKQRYIDPAPPNKIQEIKVEVVVGSKKISKPWTRVFIPSLLEDNKILTESDPMYVVNLSMAGPPWLVSAWLSGNWNIVAGGMFDDLFVPGKQERIILPWFRVPSHWRVDRSFDWGFSRPFSVGWWAESDGMPLNVPFQKEPLCLPRGSVIRIGEWYGWNGKVNEGLQMVSSQIADGILKREKRLGYRVLAGPADASIYSETDEPSVGRKMASKGVKFLSSAKNQIGGRVTGWEHMRDMLLAAINQEIDEKGIWTGRFLPREEPGLFIMDNCRQWLRTVPFLPRDKADPDDVDTNAEDHIADETRYRVCRKRYTYRHRRLK